MRVVLDTNTVISAFLWGGLPFELLKKLREGHAIISSEQLINELDAVLSRPKFIPQFIRARLTPAEVLADYRSLVVMVEPVLLSSDAVSDAKDVKVLECALGGSADQIVSGDTHLLKLKDFRGIAVVSAATLLAAMTDSDATQPRSAERD